MSIDVGHILEYAGNISSIVGVLLTLGVLITLQKVRAFYVQRVRLPLILSDLKKQSTKLNTLLSGFNDNRGEVVAELNRLKAKLNSLNKKVERDMRSPIKKVVVLIEKYKKKDEKSRKRDNYSKPEHADAYVIYSELQEVIMSVFEKIEDLNWER